MSMSSNLILSWVNFKFAKLIWDDNLFSSRKKTRDKHTKKCEFGIGVPYNKTSLIIIKWMDPYLKSYYNQQVEYENLVELYAR